MRFIIALLFGAIVLAGPGAADEASATLEEALLKAAGAHKTTTDTIRDKLDETVDCSGFTSPDVKSKCNAANEAYFDYFVVGLDHRKDVFLWQHFSTKVIFGVVIALVLIGIWFAWLQFRRGMTVDSDDIEKAGSEATTAGHTIEIGAKGVKVSSPVLGVIILTLSLGFFYLYLVYVYPVVDTI